MDLTSLALAALALPTPGDVLDAGNGQPYPTIAAAVNAASEGDTIRVFPGDHGAFAVHGKSLAIIAQGPVEFVGTARIQGLAAGQTVVLDGLRITGQTDEAWTPPLVLGLNEGSVRGLDCSFSGAWVSPGNPRPNAARFLECDDLAFTGCSFRGGAVAWLDDDDVVVEGGTAIDMTASTASFHGCWINGLYGAERSSPGGHGVVARDSRLYLQDTDVRGGNGSLGSWGSTAYWPGPAGSALILEGGHVDFLATEHDTGLDTREVDLLLGATLEDHGNGPMTLTAPRQVHGAGHVTVSMTGEASDLVFLVDGTRGARRDLPGFVGSLLVGGVVRRRPVGVGAALTLDLPLFTVPSLSAEQIHLQSVHLRPDPSSPGGRQVLFGPVRVVTVLDDAL